MILAVNYFYKMLHCRPLTGLRICLWFQIYKGSQYTMVAQGSEYVLICRIMPEYDEVA